MNRSPNNLAAKPMLVLAVCAAVLLAIAAPAAAQLRSAVTILHSIPGLSVDLLVDGEVVIAGFNAGDTQDLTPLAGQTLRNIEAREPGGGEVVIGPIDSFDVPSDGNASVVVHLDRDGEAVITTFFNEAPPLEQGRGRFIVRHVAAAPPIEVSIGDDEFLEGIDNGQEGAIDLPAGEITDAWITANGERIARLPTLQLDAHSNLTVYVGGSVADDSLAFYLQVVAAGSDSPIPMMMDDMEEIVSAGDAAAESDEAALAQTDDGTPQPVMVNTGVPITNDRDTILLLAAAGAALVAVGSFAMRRRFL